MCGTTYTSLQSSNRLNYPHMITYRDIASLYTAPLSAVNGLSCLTKLTTSKGAGTAIRFENFRIGQLLSNRIESDGWFEFESNLEALQVARPKDYAHDSTQCSSLLINCAINAAAVATHGNPTMRPMLGCITWKLSCDFLLAISLQFLWTYPI